MIEAERFLEEKKQRGAKPPPVPDSVGSEIRREHGTDKRVPPPITVAAKQAQGTQWLDIVNYGLVPLSLLISLVSLIIVGGGSGDTDVAVLVYGIDIGLSVALFFGLRKRTSWGWWLMMVLLVAKAPIAAWNKYTVECLKVQVLNDINEKLSTSYSRSHVDSDIYVWMGVGGFLLICLPQMVYFYRRRRLFGVRFEGDRT